MKAPRTNAQDGVGGMAKMGKVPKREHVNCAKLAGNVIVKLLVNELAYRPSKQITTQESSCICVK
ncbi:MAG: hypothetical protein JO269_02945 [Burkholderiaceae bacterium]|nr:hypothetical protein [Burkholderiaceae bacterium]